MKRIIFAMLILAGTAVAQSPKPADPPKVEAPKISDKARADIRELQYQKADLTLQVQQAIDRLKALDAEIARAKDAALAEVNTEKVKYYLDDRTLTLIAMPTMTPTASVIKPAK